MIEKLRKKLMALFLISTMLIFSAAMLIITGNTVLRVQDSEIHLVNNMADSVLEQLYAGNQIGNLQLAEYASKAQAWVSVTDGIKTQTTPDCLATSAEILLRSSNEDAPILLEMQTVGIEKNGESRTIYSLYGDNSEPYYGVHSTTYRSEDVMFELFLIYQQTTVWEILKNDCGMYPAIWLAVFALMFVLCRFLIKKAVQPVEAAMQSQKYFIAAASHELKSPLAVIQSNTEIMEPGPRQGIILEECGRMNKLIQSLLTLASCDAGRWQMNMQKTDVDLILIETWETHLQLAKKKCVHLKLEMEESYPDIFCDKDRISQTLGILLDNAIAYSPGNSTIEMGARVLQKNLVFWVSDHGPGIPDNEKKKVFERFYSVDSSRTEKGHYGLGLSIATEIMKLHRGTISLKDTSGGGCTFEVKIPIDNKML